MMPDYVGYLICAPCTVESMGEKLDDNPRSMDNSNARMCNTHNANAKNNSIHRGQVGQSTNVPSSNVAVSNQSDRGKPSYPTASLREAHVGLLIIPITGTLNN